MAIRRERAMSLPSDSRMSTVRPAHPKSRSLAALCNVFGGAAEAGRSLLRHLWKARTNRDVERRSRFGRWLAALAATATVAPAVFGATQPSTNPATAPEVVALERALAAQAYTSLGNRPRPTLRSLQRTLGRGFVPGTAVLVYRFTERSLDRGRLQAWLVDASGLRASGECPQTPRAIANLLGRLHSAIGAELPSDAGRGAAPLAPATRPRYDASAAARRVAALGKCLFPGSIASALGGVEHLAVVPTQFLGIVPFALLAPDGGTPLVSTTTVSVVPGPLALGPLTDGEGDHAPARPLVVGDPANWEFPSLPGARNEALAVAHRWRVEPLLGAWATLDAVAKRASQADLIYLAAHAHVFPLKFYGRGEADFIALAGKDRWTAWEIQWARLSARLVVLSGCDTTLGLSRESGVAGMEQAFHFSGVPRVVSSLWAVGDAATVPLMERFASELDSLEPAEALRRAMAAGRQQGFEPWQWAAFAASGSPRARLDFTIGSPEEVASACRDGACAVVHVPEAGRPRVLCAGQDDACAEAFLGPASGRTGFLWLARIENREALRALGEARDPNPAELTLALLEAWNTKNVPLPVFRRRLP